MYGKSYGRITNLVTNENLQDFDESQPYLTSYKIENVDQNKVY